VSAPSKDVRKGINTDGQKTLAMPGFFAVWVQDAQAVCFEWTNRFLERVTVHEKALHPSPTYNHTIHYAEKMFSGCWLHPMPPNFERKHLILLSAHGILQGRKFM